jgi:hypothetical protein
VDFDNENDSDEEEKNNIIFLELCSLLDLHYSNIHLYDVAKSQEWWHLIVPNYDNTKFKRIMRIDSQSF